MKPALRDGVSVLYRPSAGGYELNFLIESSSIIIPFEVDEYTLRCVRMLDGNHTVADISAATDVSKAAIRNLLALLHEQKLLRSGVRKYDRYEGTRFATQANFFAGFANDESPDMQAALCASRVTIIGLGGVGSWVAYGLVLAGINKLTLVDNDVVELANLNRQCLYDAASIGELKVETLTKKLKLLEPALEVNQVHCLVETQKVCENLILGADLVICCADEPGTDEVNRIVSTACYPRQIPHILCGGYDGHLGFVGPTIVPTQSGCWSCYEHTLEHQLRSAGYIHLQITPAQKKGGNLGAVSAIIANYHVMEAVKVITGFGPSTLINKVAEIDFLTYNLHLREYRKRHNCAVCGTQLEKEVTDGRTSIAHT